MPKQATNTEPASPMRIDLSDRRRRCLQAAALKEANARREAGKSARMFDNSEISKMSSKAPADDDGRDLSKLKDSSAGSLGLGGSSREPSTRTSTSKKRGLMDMDTSNRETLTRVQNSRKRDNSEGCRELGSSSRERSTRMQTSKSRGQLDGSLQGSSHHYGSSRSLAGWSESETKAVMTGHIDDALARALPLATGDGTDDSLPTREQIIAADGLQQDAKQGGGLGVVVLWIVVAMALVIGLAVGLTTAAGRDSKSGSFVGEPTNATGLPPSLSPTMISSALTGAPTSAAFDAMVELLGLSNVSSSPDHPMARALDWMLTEDTMPPTKQRLGAAIVYFSMGGAEWVDTLGFLNASSHECSNWYRAYPEVTKGILCDENATLREIQLPDNNLYGTILSELNLLPDLWQLNLKTNQLFGTIPSQVGLLTSISSFNGAENFLTGSIPSEFESASDLQALWVDDNLLDGTLPNSLAGHPAVFLLAATNNFLTGSLPNEYGDIPNLIGLLVENNFLTGTLPESYGYLPDLSLIGISDNALSGSIPSSFAEAEKITHFTCFRNDMTGTLPFLPGGLLEIAAFAENRFSGKIEAFMLNKNLTLASLNYNEFTGSIPLSLCDVTAMGLLGLAGNMFTGTIPDCISRSKDLKLLHLYENNLTGPLPPLPKGLQILRVGTNHLTGTIDQLTALSGLDTMLLAENRFSGTIPEAIGDLSLLTSLHLSDNVFTGTLPTSLGQLSALTALLLSSNDWTGSLPTELDNLATLKALQVYFTSLTGDVTNLCNTNDLPQFFADCALIMCPCCVRCCLFDTCSSVMNWEA